MQSYKSLKGQTSCEIKMKNSRFIATVAPLTIEECAHEFLSKMRHIYSDASHNVFAFRVLLEGSVLERQSDDGEPSGSAGKPALDILVGAGVVNVCVNIARYFGGTLLGTGGLVRAYQAAVREALASAQIVEFHRLITARLVVPYHCYDKFLHIARNNEYYIAASTFAEDVKLDIICRESAAEHLQGSVAALDRSADLSLGEIYYGTL